MDEVGFARSLYAQKNVFRVYLKKQLARSFFPRGKRLLRFAEGLVVAMCFARGISAKVQSLWDLIESQSTALVVRKQEHCLVIVQVLSSNAKSNVHLVPPTFVISYMLCAAG